MPRNSGAILWISESVFLHAVSLDSEVTVGASGIPQEYKGLLRHS